MNKKKMAMSITSLALVGAVAIGGTLAYLSSTTDTVTNTFNVGTGYIDDGEHQGLWLDEQLYENNEAVSGKRTEEGNNYTELLPGDIVTKDPTFYLTEGSVESYVFAEVSGLDDLVRNHFVISPTELTATDPEPASAVNSKWVRVLGVSGTLDGLYMYKASETDETVIGGEEMEPLFYNVKLSSTVTSDQFANIDPDSVIIRGVAVQADNMTAETAQAEALKVLYPELGN